jgi:hypothetical protein
MDYYIIVERLWQKWSILYYCRTYVDTWSVLYYCRTYVHNMIRIILLLNECGQRDLYYIIVERL